MICIWQFEYSIHFWPFLAQFWLYDVTRIVKFTNFGENDKRSNVSPQKIFMVPSLEHSIVVGSNILLRNCFENLGKWRQRGTLFHTFLQIFYKSFKILVLSYNLSHFLPIFKKILTKNFPRCNSLFLCNKELHKKFAPILKVCQRRHQSEKTKIGIIFDLDVIFDLRFFLKVKFPL